MRSGACFCPLRLQNRLRMRRIRLGSLVSDTALHGAIAWATACNQNAVRAVTGDVLANAGSAGSGTAFVHTAFVVSCSGTEAGDSEAGA